jgi:hypothetical protein
MPQRLKVEGLQAELSAVEMLLESAREAGDPVGEYQLRKRVENLQRHLASVISEHVTRASVALYFGGRPVFGSRGITAEFSGRVLESFQDLVARTFATEEVGSLSERGPIPQRRAAGLMVTSLARGSFGFVLEESAAQEEIGETALKKVVEKTVTLVERISSPSEVDFEEAVEDLDTRLLIAFKSFFSLLDNSGATLRLVDEVADVSLDSSSVHRGRMRTEATEIDEADVVVNGFLVGLLPTHRRFELRADTGDLLYGSVSTDATQHYLHLLESGESPIETRWAVKLERRRVTPLNRPTRDLYQLVAFLEKLSSSADT